VRVGADEWEEERVGDDEWVEWSRGGMRECVIFFLGGNAGYTSRPKQISEFIISPGRSKRTESGTPKWIKPAKDALSSRSCAPS
jgi:hypothetical protein